MNNLVETILSTISNTCLSSLVKGVEESARAQAQAHSMGEILMWHAYGMINLHSDLLGQLEIDKAVAEARAKVSQRTVIKAVALLSAQNLAQDAGDLSPDVFALSLEEKIKAKLNKNKKEKVRVIDIKTGKPYFHPRTRKPFELKEFLASGMAGKETDFLFAIDGNGKRETVANNPWTHEYQNQAMQEKILKENPRLAARLRTEGKNIS